MSSLCLDIGSVGQECVNELVLFWTLLYIQTDSSQPGIAGKFTKPPELCFLLELPFKFLAHLQSLLHPNRTTILVCWSDFLFLSLAVVMTTLAGNVPDQVSPLCWQE